MTNYTTHRTLTGEHRLRPGDTILDTDGQWTVLARWRRDGHYYFEFRMPNGYRKILRYDELAGVFGGGGAGSDR
jgi:hypothetical protein